MTEPTVKNLNQHNITDEVLRRIAKTPNKRLHEILTSLVRHLHDFAREVHLSEAEWFEGIGFLTRTGQLCTDTRQEFILLSDTLGLSQLVVAQNHSRPEDLTEQTVFGPFHVEGAPRRAPHGSDLATGLAGDPLFVDAEVYCDGKPLAEAVVDVWQADSEGFYDVQDPDWTLEQAELRAVFRTDAQGRISFRTILPMSYPIPTDGTVGEMLRATERSPMRPAHMHFRVAKPGYDTLITHVFVDGDKYLDSDAVFGVRASCIGNYVRHEAGEKVDGVLQDAPFYKLDYRFALHPQP
jgi:hydroxyquinol 1,2-dioxygenase